MEKQLKKQAKEIFTQFCSYLKGKELNFGSGKVEGGYNIEFSGEGDDLPIKYKIFIDSERGIIHILSPLPFVMSKKRLLDGAVGIHLINYSLIDGNFDYNVNNGEILFRLNTCWRGATIDENVFEYLIYIVITTVDKYNEKLFMLSKGRLSLAELAEEIE